LAAEFDCVRERIEAAHQERCNAQAVVAQNGICNLLGRTHEAGGAAERPRRFRDAHPKPLVVHLLLLCEGELSPAGMIGGGADALLPGPAELAGHAAKDALGLVPGLSLRRGNDRTDRHVEAHVASALCGACTECCNALCGGCTRLGVEREHVTLCRAHLERPLRGTAKHDQRVRFLQWANIGMGAANPVEPPIKVERSIAGPSSFDEVEVFLRALIALSLGCEIAVSLLLGVRLASNDVECEPAAS